MFKNIFRENRTRGFEVVLGAVYGRSLCHTSANPSSRNSFPRRGRISQRIVGIFWDLSSNLPDYFPPYVTASRVRFAVSLLGSVHHLCAYGGPEVFTKMPQAGQVKKKRRKKHNQMGKKDQAERTVPFLCRFCGRLFPTNDKRVDHFKKLHEPEHVRRLNQIESASGGRRVSLVGRYSMKMDKYKNAKREILASVSGVTIADELGRAGFRVSSAPRNRSALLRNHAAEVMETKTVDCVVLLSDDSSLLGLVKQAKDWGVRTFVVSDKSDDLKRNADAGFSWKDVLFGKVQKQAPKVAGRWDDQDALKGLEWTYEPERECTSGDRSRAFEEFIQGVEDDPCCKKDSRPWWELS